MNDLKRDLVLLFDNDEGMEVSEYIGGKTNLALAAEHGLSIAIKCNENPEQSRLNRDSIWVGIDVYGLDEALLAEFSDEEVRNNPRLYVEQYCKNILKCAVDDIIWHITDHYSVGHAMIFAMNDGNNGWIEYDCSRHFIYITKEAAQAKYGAMESDAITAMALADFAKEVDEYNQWCNSDVFFGLVKPKQENEINSSVLDVISCKSDIMGAERKEAYSTVSNMIDSTIEAINNAGSGSVSFKVSIKGKTSSKIDIASSPTIHIISQIEKMFGFTPAIGTINIDEVEKTVEMTWLLASIPHFLALCNNARKTSKFNLFDMMTNNVRFIGDEYDFESIDESTLINLLTNDDDYSVWSNHMLISLLTTLFNGTKDFTFHSVSWDPSRVKGSNTEPENYQVGV